MKKYIKSIAILGFASMMLSSCWIDKSEPNYVFMPNMYYSEAYEPYAKAERPWDDRENTVEAFKDGMTALKPVAGTVPRTEGDILPMDLPNTPEGYATSKTITQSPLPLDEKEADLERGEYLYGIYCAVCHGANGDGKGILVQNDKIKGVPNYKDRSYITVGSAHWVITNGRGIMGSHASQLTSKERWQVAEYVMKLKGE
ncbi:hypothetical protein UJ101_01473 [Flavobacteriaceae bacterium UJ101]|nr:hypothetical protein UJ101_01473 [Flavobacteriaceae bacterium UJ101]